MQTHMSVPLDSDGYLRRACPACRREFKWLPQDGGEPAPANGYYCPYCAAQADPDSWWTDDQVRLAEAHAADMAQGQLENALRGLRQNSGPIRIDYRAEARFPMPHLSEPDDMAISISPCHPGEPIKIEETGDRAVYCLVCGADYRRVT